jgi:hypothetical protein
MQPGSGGDPFAMRQRGAITLTGTSRQYASDLAVAGDLDADGFVDLVVSDPPANTAEIVWGRADTLTMPERSPLPDAAPEHARGRSRREAPETSTATATPTSR